MIVLSNEEIEELVTAADCIQVLDEAYRDLAVNEAGNIPRADLIAPVAGDMAGAHYGFKTMSGGFPRRGVTALRINSDVVTWPGQQGSLRRVKVPAVGGRYVGLVLLFSNATGELLAIMPDGVMQRLRVGATSALAAGYLARAGAATMGLLGSGGQARGQVLAFAARPGLKRIRVFSPNEQNRQALVADVRPLVCCEVEAVSTPEAAVAGADIVSCATNSLDAVFKTEWVRPGLHITCVKRTEISPEAFLRCDVLFQHFRKELEQHILGKSQVPDEESVRATVSGARVDWGRTPELASLVSGGTPGRTRDDQVTGFCNNIGMGLQFAAVGALVYEKARQRGAGRELPTEWFTEAIRP